jgi:chitin synthase
MAFAGSNPFISAYGQNSFDEFCINFADELLHFYVVRNTFKDTVGRDGVSLLAIITMDNSACVELLRGSQLNERVHRKSNGVIRMMSKASSSFKPGKTSDNRDKELLQDLVTKLGVHSSFVASLSVSGFMDRNIFGINHYSGNCSYDVSGFVEKDAGLLDATFVSLLRQSSDPWISKLMSGLGMALERHHKDKSILVQAQIISHPICHPTPVALPDRALSPEDEHAELNPGKTYAVMTQLNYTLSQIFANLDRTKHWTISCIWPNDSGSPNSFNKQWVKAQICSLLLPDIVARYQTEFVVE